MNIKKANQVVNNHEIGAYFDWKFGLITITVYRIAENKFEINDTSDGWTTAIVAKSTLIKLYTGEKSLLTINFK